MALFGSKDLSFLPPIDNLTLTKEGNQAKCSRHNQEATKLYAQKVYCGRNHPFATCSACKAGSDHNAGISVRFQANSENLCCAVSAVLSKPNTDLEVEPVIDPPLDFGDTVYEHMLWDVESQGYGVRSLVYMRDFRLLATCSKKGNICFWSIGDTVELKGPKLKIQQVWVNFAKYSEETKHFVVGTNRGVHIYLMEEKGPKFGGNIDVFEDVKDLDFMGERKVIMVYNGGFGKVWDLVSLEMEKRIDLEKFEIKGEVHTVIHMKRTDQLAIEHKNGLSVINWRSEGVKHYIPDQKLSYGCVHLAQSKKFIINNGFHNVEVLNEEDLSVEQTYRHDTLLLSPSSFPRNFVATKDESQILVDVDGTRLGVYKGSNFDKHLLSPWNRCRITDIALMENQYRFAIADHWNGVVSIFRTNSSMHIQTSHGYSLPPATLEEFDPSKQPVIPLSAATATSKAVSKSKSSSGAGSGSEQQLLSSKSIGSGSGIELGGQLKASRQGKKIQKVEVGPKNEKKKISLTKKDTKKKAKALLLKPKTATKSVKPVKPVKPEEKKQEKDKEEGLLEALRVRTKKGGKGKAKEEKAWIVLPQEEEEKRGRSKDVQKKAGKRTKGRSEDKSRSRSNSKSITRGK